MVDMVDLDARMGGTPVALRRGPWSLEVRGDEVAQIAFQGVHLIRAIRPVVRDQDWNTVPVTLVDQQRSDDGTSLVSQLLFAADGIRYRGTVTVTLTDGGLLVDFQGSAGSIFLANRIGLVVLHPATDAGRPVDVRHCDGQVKAGRWPTAISPHQPFRDVAGFSWTRDGVTASMSLSGDIFETEDQRNWTDASFKTYSTPLSRPFPVTVRAGATVSQHVRLEATGSAAARPQPPGSTAAAGTPAETTVRIGDTAIATMPPIGLGASVYPLPPRLPSGGHHYATVLVELTGPEDRWPVLLQAAADQADALRAFLDVRIVTADPQAVGRALSLRPLTRVVRLAAFDPQNHISTASLWQALTTGARQRDFAGQLVAGTRAHFTELNRMFDQLPGDAPALTFSLTPQMHATEIPHIIDSLATQSTVAANARRLAGGRPVHVGPITLARRFNAVTTTGQVNPETDAARAVDPLLTTDVAAAWTLGSVAALARAGLASLSYFESIGPRGIRSDGDEPWPVGTVLDRLAALTGRPVLEVTSPTGTAALAVRDPGGVRLFLANLSADPRTVSVRFAGGVETSVELGPWAVSDTVTAS